MKIIGTGINGLVGSRIVELLPHHTFQNVSRQTGFDVSNKDHVFDLISSSDASHVLHLAAKTQVDECEKEKDLGEESEAWKINVLGTEYISEACKEFNKKMIFVSTDFVFDGYNPPQEGYSEEDMPNPVNWYGQTKYEAEKKVLHASSDFIIARITYPYRTSFSKNDFVRAILSKLAKGEEVQAVEDIIMTPTFIDDIAGAIDTLIQKDKFGIYHLVGSQWVTPYEIAEMLAEKFSFSKNLIKKMKAEEFLQGRAPRPLHLKTKNDKILKLGVKMKTFKEGLEKITL